MRTIVLKNWPYPDSVRAMLLRVENPIYDGNSNWHIDLVFRSIKKEDKVISVDWGLLPMLKTGQIFSNGSKIGDNLNLKKDKFRFDNRGFEFFIDRIKTVEGIVERPAFQARVGGIYFNIPVIEVARSFFARKRKLAYTLLETNSIVSLCQSEIDKTAPKRVVLHFSPECPFDLTREQWLPMLAWMASNQLAKLSWDSFYRYFRSCESPNVVPVDKVSTPIFPINGPFSLECRYRSYGNTIWFEEITSIECNSMEFDEICVVKYIYGNRSNSKSQIVSYRSPQKIEISNSASSALQGHVILDVDLPGFIFKRTPRISIVKKILGIDRGFVNHSELFEESINATGKNEGFINSLVGVDFSSSDHDHMGAAGDMWTIPELKEVRLGNLQYNYTLLEYLEVIDILSRKWEVLEVGTKIYEFPGDSSFAWITSGIRRCCAISIVKLVTGKTTYIVEAERSTYRSNEKWKVSTLLLNIKEDDHIKTILRIVKNLAISGHWETLRLKNEKNKVVYERLKHGNEINKSRWAGRILDALMCI